MKKIIFNTIALLAVIGLFFVSCEKEDSQEHQYTEEELREIARQDSLKQIIPADYIFTQDLTIPLTDDYTGITLSLVADKDTAKLLELFEYNTVAELVLALGTLTDGVQSGNDITFYAYNYSTKYEYANPSTTNYFGHWFDANGDVCNWGDQAYLYCEKVDETTLDFQIACFPSRPVTGTTYKIVEAMKYDTTSVAFLFNVTIGDAPEEPELVYPVTTIVGTETHDIDAEKNIDYAATPVSIDAAAITAAIGIAPGDAEIYGIDASDDSLYIYGSTAEDPGYWFNATGDVCNWGDTLCAIYANYIIADQLFNVGQYPEGTTPGETYTVKIAFVNLDNLKQYNVIINVNITAGEPEPVDDYPKTTLEATIELALSVNAVGEGVWVDNLIALDSAAIQTAIGCGPSAADLYGISASTDSLYMDGFTAINGCWFNGDGDVAKWGSEGLAMYAEYRPETYQIGVGQYPGACSPGDVYQCKLAFVNGNKRAEVVITMTIN